MPRFDALTNSISCVDFRLRAKFALHPLQRLRGVQVRAVKDAERLLDRADRFLGGMPARSSPT